MITKYSEEFVTRDDVLLLYNSFSHKKVVIDPTIKIIAQASFMGHTEIEQVILPESITQIAKFAFAECHSLQEIVLGKNICTISDDAFDGCCSLSAFYVDVDNPFFKSVNGVIYSKDGNVLFRVPPNYRGDEVFTIPYGVKKIAVNAFNRVLGIKNIIIPDTVQEIGYKAFCYCDDLEEIKIGEHIKTIGYCALSNTRSLKRIFVDKNNKNYLVDDNALYSYDKKTLIQLPCAFASTRFVIKNTVATIEDRALSNHKYLTEIISESPFFKAIDGVLFNASVDTLLVYPTKKANTTYVVPDDVVEISGSAFQGCSEIREIVFGKSLKKISRHGFEGSSISIISGGESLEHIGWCSFSHCNNLKKLNFSNTRLSYVNGGAFSFCSKLEKIALPATVNQIIRWSFIGCNNLASIEFNGDINHLLFDGASFFITEDEFGKIY